MTKYISIQGKIPGHPLFIRASASCSRLLNVKSIFNTGKNFWATLFFRARAVAQKY